MTTGDDQPTRRVPPAPAPAPVRGPVADLWEPSAADPGPDDQLTRQVALPTQPAADAQTVLAETVVATPKAPETVLISPLTGPAPGEVLRFGPGVPPRTGPDMSRAASIWRGERQPDPDADGTRRGRGAARWILPLLVLLAVLAVLLWRSSGASIAVTGVSVRAGRQTLACDSTETVTGVLDTNGEEGTVTYRWQRSDGTASGTLQQHIAKGAHQSEVTLLWTFNGKGAMHATATLDVLSPGSQAASAGFTYNCP